VSRSDIERVRDILDCIEAIDRAEATVQRYPGDLDVARVALDALQSRVFTIGQEVKALSLDMREDHPAVAWSDMAGMRELTGHHHDRLDPQLVRAAIGEPVERLRAACRAILAESVRVGEDEP
jgi:uncharacterized protein with HEPN domain